MAQNPSADRPSVRQFVRSRLRWQLWLLLFAAICAIVLSLTVLIAANSSSHSCCLRLSARLCCR